MAFVKDPLNATNPREIIEYSQDLEDRVEVGFDSTKIKKVSLTRTLDNASYATFTNGYPLIIVPTDVGNTGVQYSLDIGHTIQNRAGGGFLISFRNAVTGIRLGGKTLSFDVYYIEE